MPSLPRSRAALPVLLACCLVVLLLGAALVSLQGRGPVATATVGGPFALVDQDGRPVTEASLEGHPSLVFFGYTHCPDVCPTTLSDMSQLLEALGPATDVAVLFITVDPERDTPAVLKAYLSSFDPRIRGLTGSPAAVTAAEKSYRAYAKKEPPGPDGSYAMDHTAIVYVMDAQGRFVNALDLGQPTPKAAAALRAML